MAAVVNKLPAILICLLGWQLTIAEAKWMSKSKGTEYLVGAMELSVPTRYEEKICITYPHQYYDLYQFSAKSYKLLDYSEIDLCVQELKKGDLPDSGDGSLFLLSARSNCSIRDNFAYIKESGAGLVLLSNISYSMNSSHGLEVFALVSDSAYFESLNLTGADMSVKLYGGKGFQLSTIVLFSIAVLCIIAGSMTGIPTLNTATAGLVRTDSSEEGGADKDDTNPIEQVNFNLTLIVMMVFFITTTLLLLYFFYKYLVYFFIAIFCFASARATYCIVKQILSSCKVRLNIYKIKSYDVAEILLGLACLSLAAVWFIFRRKPITSAILQDTLGVFFCINMIQSLRIPNLKWCTTLLSMLFVYDVFFVFITPYFTSDGESIMGAVATGGSGSGSSHGEAPEQLPLLMKVPHLGNLGSCAGPSMLGFGDIIVPGILTGFAYTFDKLSGNKCRPYFLSTLVGYVVGLILAFIALFITSMGQPALLYIVPATLILIFSVGLWRKEVRDLWTGSIPHRLA